MAGGISWVEYPYARIRTEVETEQGDVTRFVVQLEYNVNSDPLAPGDWRQVARFDNQPDAEGGHDVREEGLHMDIYREKVDVRRQFDTPESNDAPRYCRTYFPGETDELLARFENWHGIDGNWND